MDVVGKDREDVDSVGGKDTYCGEHEEDQDQTHESTTSTTRESVQCEASGHKRITLKFRCTINLTHQRAHTVRFAWAPDGQLVVLSSDYRVLIYKRSCSGQYDLFTKWRPECSEDIWSNVISRPRSVAVSPDGDIYIAMENCVHAYSLTGELVGEFDGPYSRGVECVAITTNGRIVIGNRFCDKRLVVLNPSGTKTKFKISQRQYYMTLIDDSKVACCNLDREVYVIDISSGQQTLSIDLSEGRRAVGSSYDEPSDSLIIATSDTSDIGIVKIEQYSYSTGNFVACLANQLVGAFDLALSAQRVLAVADNGSIQLYDLENE